jgi:parallel beta-helix repeat protein
MKRAVAIAAAVLIALAVMLWPTGERVEIVAGDDLGAALSSAGAGDTVVLGAGEHRGPVTVEREVTVEAEPGAVLVAPPSADAALSIAASGTRVTGLSVRGGSTGILVREVQNVELEDVSVTAADLHGIEVVDASARITGAHVDGLVSEMAQGIEVRNSDGRPDTIIESAVIDGGQEGIVTHVSEVEFRDNEVANTTMRGIVVTEMSDGIVTGNRVSSAAGSGFYCGDMSRCAFEGNVAEDVSATTGGTSEAGWGLVVTYHAVASSTRDRLTGDAGDLLTSMHGAMRDRSPLNPSDISVIALPGLLSILVAAAAGGLAFIVARPLSRRIPRVKNPAGVGVAVMAVGLVVQSFHMVEHFLQVYRVKVDHIPSRGGLAGPGVDSEWVHLAYNVTVLAMLVVAVAYAGRRSEGARAAVVGATVVQAWHSIEHVAKVIQHVTLGAKVNPGVIGGNFDLVWFHFTINLVVYALGVLAALLWILAQRRTTTSPVRARPLPA